MLVINFHLLAFFILQDIFLNIQGILLKILDIFAKSVKEIYF